MLVYDVYRCNKDVEIVYDVCVCVFMCIWKYYVWCYIQHLPPASRGIQSSRFGGGTSATPSQVPQ